MKAAAAAGWKLYQLLKSDPAIEPLLAAIDALPDGSRITVASNATVFPWELMYPREYVVDYPIENYDSGHFWGQRFVFESLLIVPPMSEKPPASRRQPDSMRIRMGLNSGIDREPPWNASERPLMPVKLQKEYCDAALKQRGGYFDTYEMLSDTFRTAYTGSMIYYFCHGAASQLQFDKLKSTFRPEHIMGDPYPGWPVVFLNACDAADISPLSFFSFRSRFRTKKAAGLIAPSFPVPTLFAALFGRAFLSEYVMQRPIGEILLGLRRRLIKNDNPLGLWYSLQCLLDIRAPET